MITRLIVFILIIGVSTPSTALEPLPDIVQGMLDAAIDTGDPAQIEAVANAARKVFPDYEAAISETAQISIDALSPPEEIASDSVTAASDGIWRLGAWTGNASAGASLASGNSDNIAVGLGIEAARTHGVFTHNISADLDLASSNPDPNDPASQRLQTQNRWFTAYQLDLAFSDRTYAFGRISYEEDAFSGFDYRAFGGAGVGHFLYKSEPFKWKVEGGPGYQYSLVDITPEIQSEFALYASTEIDWLIREGVLFEQDVDATWTSPTTTVESLTSLSTTLTESISTSLSFFVRYETNPPLTRQNVDTLLKASVNYGF
ncbi:MAG: DUF481 domain-containing protein [Pseudomonadota bacterium]